MRVTDPDDDLVLAPAVQGRANVVCTWDRDLRQNANVQSYCALHGIRVLKDSELLAELRS